MRTKEQIEEEIKVLQDELELLPKEPERWRGKNGDVYWYTEDGNNVFSSTDSLGNIDNFRYKSFNYFKTEVEAKRIAKTELSFRTLDWAMSGMEIGNLVLYVDSNTLKLKYFEDNDLQSPLKSLSESDAKYIIETYPTELRTFLTGGRK